MDEIFAATTLVNWIWPTGMAKMFASALKSVYDGWFPLEVKAIIFADITVVYI